MILTDAQAASVSSALAGNLGVEETPAAWKERLVGMVSRYADAYAEHHPGEPRLTDDEAWDRMRPMLIALGADL